MDKFLETIHDMIEIITGKRPEQEIERAKGYTKEHTQQWLDSVDKPKRARGKKGRYLADDKSTPNVNEAWVGGKAPKRKKKKNVKK
tara:strand:+ start:94 stop:351 length:258 start_codon:yes stop_codon:yes gene_type:complete